MKNNFFLVIVAIAILILSSCFSPQPVINELSNTTSTYEETIRINNCGNQAESTQTASRSFATKISGTGTIKAGYDKIVEGSVSATYEQYKNSTKTQILTAAPNTNMEFILKWSDNVRSGNVTINGDNVDYTVNIPIAVEQVSSQDLGCATILNTVTPRINETNTAISTPILQQAPQGNLVLDENFDDGNDNDFYYGSENWVIVDDGTGNKVLQANKSNSWSYARFGPTDFSDGTIEYIYKLTEKNTSQYSGLIFLIFREQPQASYIFATDYGYSTLDFKYTGSDTSDKWISISGGTVNYDFQKDKWYSVRVTLSGSKVSIYFDQRLAIEADDSRLSNGQLKFGIASFNTVAQFDNVRVWTDSK